MPNKISGLSSDTAPIGAGRPAERVRDAGSGGSSALTDGSNAPTRDVHITDSASQLATLEQTLRSLPAVDPARVAQFSSAIEQGTYAVHSQQIADQLMQLERSLSQLPED